MATVTELVTEFSFSGSEAPLNRYNRSLNQSIALLASLAAALAASGAAVGKWASGVLQGERSMYNLSFETGIAIEKLQQLNFVAEMSGASSQAMQSSMESLSAAIGDAAQRGSEDFARLGIAVRDANGYVRSADAVFRDVQNRFKQLGLSMAEQRSFAAALGIDTSLLRMMNQTSGQISELMARAQELGTLNESQAKQAEQYNQALVVQRFAMDGLRRLIAVGLAPELTSLVDKFTGLIEKNKEWIVYGVKATLEVLNDLIVMLGRTWPVLAAGTAVFIGLKVATFGWVWALRAVRSTAIIAGLFALVAIAEDLIVAFNGGKSAIRDFFLEFFDYDIQPALKEITRGFTKMVDGAKIAMRGWLDFLKRFYTGIENIGSGDFKIGFEDIEKAFTGLWESTKESFITIFGEAIEWIKQQISGITPDWVKKLTGGDASTPSSADRADIGNQLFSPGGGQSATGRYSQVNQNVEINVRTSDPERAARLTSDNLQRQMADAQAQIHRNR